MTLQGLTGEIKFDQKGQRSNFTLELIEIDDGVEPIGTWNYFSGLSLTRSISSMGEKTEIIPENFSIRSKHLRVLIALVSMIDHLFQE